MLTLTNKLGTMALDGPSTLEEETEDQEFEESHDYMVSVRPLRTP